MSCGLIPIDPRHRDTLAAVLLPVRAAGTSPARAHDQVAEVARAAVEETPRQYARRLRGVAQLVVAGRQRPDPEPSVLTRLQPAPHDQAAAVDAKHFHAPPRDRLQPFVDEPPLQPVLRQL